MALLDKNDKEIGFVGDDGWDLAGEFVEKFISLYCKEVGRRPTWEELEYSVSFVFIKEDEDGKC